MQIKHALEGYWLENQSRLSENTLPGYQWAFRHLTEYIGEETELASITSNDLRRFFAHLKDDLDLSGKSRNNIWVVLSSFWSWAEREPALRVPHPIRGIIQQPKFTKKKIVPYTQAEVIAMINACDLTATWTTRNGNTTRTTRATVLRDRAIIILLVDTGLRASELCNLRVRDYNAKNGEIDVVGKGDKERTVIAGVNARKALWRYLATRPDPRSDEPLFTSRSKLPLHKDNLRHLVQRVASRVGVKGATLHKFRHTFAINFLRNGGNVIELKRFLGHEQMETVTIYVNLAETDLLEAQRRASPADNWRLK
jgi:integrase/recombinase XerD